MEDYIYFKGTSLSNFRAVAYNMNSLKKHGEYIKTCAYALIWWLTAA